MRIKNKYIAHTYFAYCNVKYIYDDYFNDTSEANIFYKNRYWIFKYKYYNRKSYFICG